MNKNTQIINSSDEFEGDVVELLNKVFCANIDDLDDKKWASVMEKVHEIMDMIARTGEELLGIPEMYTYPYMIERGEMVVIWSLAETQANNNMPMFWSNEDGWGSFPNATVFRFRELREKMNMPNGWSAVVPWKTAGKMYEEHYKEGV